MLRRILLMACLAGAPALACAALADGFVEQNAQRLDALFSQLDPAHPQVGPMVSEWRDGRREQAAGRLADYFAAKAFDTGVLDAPFIPEDVVARARGAVRGEFLLLDRMVAVPASGDGLDWEYRGQLGDKEQAWMLNRHAFLPELAEAWRMTGDEIFRERLDALWRDWILSNPYPARLTFSPQWRPLEAARRVLNSWTHVFYARPGLLSPETRLLALCSIADHGDALRHHASFWGGNHLISEKLALLALAVAWPEFRDAAGWRDYAIAKVEEQILEQTYPDGSYMELSNHYQRVVLVNAQLFLRLLAEVDPAFRGRPVYKRIESMWDFFAGVMRPDGMGPLNNASDLEDNAGRLLQAWEFFGREDWLGIATRGARGTLPQDGASRPYPWAGQVILRDNWGPSADWIYFDAGPYGTAHQHVDRLHVSASLDGRPLLVDTGRYTYVPGVWKDYFSGPAGHSVLLLDGQTARQGPRKAARPMSVEFEDRGAAAFAAAVAEFEPRAGAANPLSAMRAPVPWTRAILYDKRGFALILDHVVTFSGHDLEARWHFHPDVTEDEAARTVSLLAPESEFSAAFQRGRGEPPLGGFYSPDYNRKDPAVLMRTHGRLAGPVTLVWLLQAPGAAGAARAEILSAPGAPVLHLRLILGGTPAAEARVRLFPQPRLLDYKPL